jgi:hypothetical protein
MGVKGVVDDKERSRLVFTIFLLADALVTSNFTALHVLSDPNMWTILCILEETSEPSPLCVAMKFLHGKRGWLRFVRRG